MSHIIMLITAAFAGGIWCSGYFVGLLPFLYAGMLLTACTVLWRLFNQQQPTIWLLAVLFFIAGMVRFIHSDTLSKNDIGRYAGEIVTVQAIVEETPRIVSLPEDKSKITYKAAIYEVQVKERKETASGILYISIRQPSQSPVFKQGDKIKATGPVMTMHGYNNPGQYDSVAAANLQGIRGRMTVQGNRIELVGRNVSFWKTMMEQTREKINTMVGNVMPLSHKAILMGMLFGGYEGIPRNVITDFSTTGIVHILSVSGSHIALVVSVITVAGKRLFRRIAFADKAIPLLAAIFVCIYGVFCGLTPPVLRSLIMGLIGLGAVCLERENDAKVALSLAVLGMLIYQPALFYDLSFQLSLASTAGLVFCMAKTLRAVTFSPLWVANSLAVTIAAQIGVLPFIAWYFNNLSISSLAANLLIVPIIEGIVILGLLGVISGMVSGFIGSVCLVSCSLLISLVLQLTEWLASVPAAKIYMPPIGVAGGIGYYVVISWLYGYIPSNRLSLKELVQKWPQKSAIIVMTFIVCIMVYRVYPTPLAVHFIDVGQGDAALIITPHGRSILVDSGGTIGENTDFDVGYRVVLPYLRHYGVQEIDYLFLTHGHQDHAGGAAGIAREIPVKHIMLPREEYSPAVMDLLRFSPASVRIAVDEGQKIELDGTVIKVLHADDGVGQKHSGNEISSVLQVRYGNHSFLFTGDLPAQGEEDMLKNGRDISSTVLKVGHHGSKTSSTIPFLQAVAPQCSVISVGKNNSFGHPHQETIQRLLSQNSKIYRTDQQGAIVFRTDGEVMTVETFLK